MKKTAPVISSALWSWVCSCWIVFSMW